MRSNPEISPIPSTVRARRCRERQKCGRRIIQFELLPDEIDAFVRSGLLAARDRNDRERLGHAPESVMEFWKVRQRP
jgi:hypothetical protein